MPELLKKDPYDPQVIAAITQQQEEEAQSEYDMVEKYGGAPPDPVTRRPSTLADDQRQVHEIIKRHRENAKRRPSSDSEKFDDVADEEDPQKRWIKFAEHKGLDKEIKIVVPTQEEVKVVEKTKTLENNFDIMSIAQLGMKMENDKDKKIVNKVIISHPEQIKKKQKTSSVKKSAESEMVNISTKPVTKEKKGDLKKKRVQEIANNEPTRKELFEQNPDRADWVLSDLVKVEGMHPGMIRTYRQWAKELRQRKPNISYGEARASLNNMNPYRFKKRSAERRYHIGI